MPLPAGSTQTLTVSWLEYPGGPAAAVTAVTITITRLSDLVVILGPTSVGITQVATGLNAYPWAIPSDAAGDYVVVWDGLDSGSEPTQTYDSVTVGAADFAYDLTTPVGKIRLLISDTNPARPIFTDAEIAALYAQAASNVRLAAADCLDTIASNEALVSKAITTQDLQTDGPKVAAELRARAVTLRETAGDYDDEGNLFGMAVIHTHSRLFRHELADRNWGP